MKKTRLLEIIREEISYALKENYSTTEASCGSSVEEDQLDEMAKITEPIGDALRMAVERIQSQDSSLTADQITKLVRNKKSQELVAPELKAALEKDEEEKGGEIGYTPGLGYPQTLKAVERIMGLSTPGKRGRKAALPTEPTEEIPTDAMDVEDKMDVDVSVDMEDEAPLGDIGMEKAARGRDELIMQYKNVMDTYKKKKAEEGDESAIAYLKTKQDIVKKYKKAKEVTV